MPSPGQEALDRLVSTSGPGTQALTIVYDAIGNVTSRNGAKVAESAVRISLAASGPRRRRIWLPDLSPSAPSDP